MVERVWSYALFPRPWVLPHGQYVRASASESLGPKIPDDLLRVWANHTAVGGSFISLSFGSGVIRAMRVPR